MHCHRIAASLVLVFAASAPWFLGAKSRISGVVWLATGLLVGAFGLLAVRSPKRIFRPCLLNGLVGGLLVCLAVFAIRGEPEFATEFSKRLYLEQSAQNPGGFIHPPWSSRLAFYAACLLGLLAVVRLAESEVFRRNFLTTIGLSGISVAIYSLAQRLFGLPLVPWALIEGGPERFNACFFHYSATAACINLAWPLLVFGPPLKWFGHHTGRLLTFQLTVLALVLAALAPLGSAAGLVVTIGLAVVGFGWPWWAQLGLPRRRVLVPAVVGVFGMIVLWQGFKIFQVAKQFPDGWKGAKITVQEAAERDVRLEQLSRLRGDRIVPTESPVRPTLWLAGLRMAMDHPLLGRGPGTWVELSSTYSNDSFVLTFFHAKQFIHNDLLQLFAEWGILSGSVFLALIFRGFNRVPGILSLVLIGAAIHSLVDFPFQVPGIQCIYFLLTGVAGSGQRKNRTFQFGAFLKSGF